MEFVKFSRTSDHGFAVAQLKEPPPILRFAQEDSHRVASRTRMVMTHFVTIITKSIARAIYRSNRRTQSCEIWKTAGASEEEDTKSYCPLF